jgi:hypothetical protein
MGQAHDAQLPDLHGNLPGVVQLLVGGGVNNVRILPFFLARA